MYYTVVYLIANRHSLLFGNFRYSFKASKVTTKLILSNTILWGLEQRGVGISNNNLNVHHVNIYLVHVLIFK